MAAGKLGDGYLPYVVGADGWPLGGPSDAEFAHAAETRLQAHATRSKSRSPPATSWRSRKVARLPSSLSEGHRAW
jgi:hypothetical protein